ncbi:MAG: Hsp20/alpha crystallin family protein [Anaerolineae bacterium]
MSAQTVECGDIKESPLEWQNARIRRWRPPTDVYETGEHVVIKVEIAGMKTEDFSISFDDRRLVISGCRRDRTEKIIYQNMEIPYGEFRTEVKVSWPIVQTDIEALYEGGFLYVKLPKRTREIRVPIK